MNTALPALSGTRLHLWPIIREALAFPWEYRHSLWKWILVCGGLVGLIDFGSEILNPKDVGEEYGLIGVLAVFILGVLALIYVVFCIRCHRLVLLDQTTNVEVFPPSLGEREGKFFGFFLIIIAGFLVILLCGVFCALILIGLFGISPSSFVDWPYSALFMIPFSYMLGRFCMVFPATAVDFRPTLNWAWEQSKDVAWRLGILVGIVPWVLSFLYDDLHAWLFFGLNQYPFAYSLITGMLWHVWMAIEVAVLSIAFRELSGFVSQEERDRKVSGPETAKESHV